MGVTSTFFPFNRTTSFQLPLGWLVTASTSADVRPSGILSSRERTQGTFVLRGCVSSTFLRPIHSVRKPGFILGPPQSRTFQPGAKVATSAGSPVPAGVGFFGLREDASVFTRGIFASTSRRESLEETEPVV